MKVGLILHLYQPPTQDEATFRKITEECYLPLLKVISENKNSHFTLNISLSLLEQMDNYGYGRFIDKVKDLYKRGNITILGSAAYHPLLTKIKSNFVENQIILNEYGLGYYLGEKSGFEGEPSIMVKDIIGFFPPELALNQEVLKILSDLGYQWVISENEEDFGSSFNEHNDIPLVVINRDRRLSNLLSFNRDTDTIPVLNHLRNLKEKDVSSVACLDAEVFGHHYHEGIYYLQKLLEDMTKEGFRFSKITDVVSDNRILNKEDYIEKTWALSEEGDSYKLWISSDNKLQKQLWDIEKKIVKNLNDFDYLNNSEEFAILPFWKPDYLSKIQDDSLRNNLFEFIVLNKFLHSDKYWWLSDETIFDTHLYDPKFVVKSLDLLSAYLENISDKKVKEDIERKISKLKEALSTLEKSE